MEEKTVPILVHLQELRKRLVNSAIAIILCMIPGFLLYNPLIRLLIKPFEQAGLAASAKPLYITSIFEGFFMNMKYALILGLLFSAPFHLYQLLRFIFPGLNKKEKRIIAITLLASSLLSITSLYCIYSFMLPLTINVLTSQNFIPQNVGLLLNFQTSIAYITDFLLYGVLAFQFPIVLELLLYLNILKRKTVWKATRFVIVIILIIAAIISPADVVSMLSLAIPMIGLYFLTLLIAKLCKFGEG